MDELVPPHYITPKIAFFSGVEDRENHLTAFRAQMIISGGLDAIRCKMLMGTFTGTVRIKGLKQEGVNCLRKDF